MKKIYIIAALATLLLTSCEKGFITPMSDPSDTLAIAEADKSFETEFVSLWEGINNSYVFWSVDTLNWDTYREKLITLGKQLDKEAKADKTAFNEDWMNENSKNRELITNLFKNFIDHHMSIRVVNPYIDINKRRSDKAANQVISPGDIRVQTRSNYHDGLEIKTYIKALQKTGLAGNTIIQAKYIKDKNNTTQLYSCIINGNIPYLHMDGYSMWEIMDNDKSSLEGKTQAQAVITTFFKNIRDLKKSGNLKGVILDNRDNGGGAVADLEIVVGAFLEEDQTVIPFHKKSKYGIGKYDIDQAWSEEVIFSLKKAEGYADVIKDIYVGSLGDIPYIVLQNMYSVSMGEMTGAAVLCLASLDKLQNKKRIVGETSFGGHGNLLYQSYADNHYNGTFNYYDGYMAYGYHGVYTVNYFVELWDDRERQFKMLESIGLKPDVESDAKFATLKAGLDDNQLRDAVKLINEIK